MPKNKLLTKDECKTIEQLLRERIPLKQIASRLGISMSIISMDARINAQSRSKFERYRIHNKCVKRRDCGKRYLCGDIAYCTKSCSGCDLCNVLCVDFVEEACIRLYESPYCCSGCPDEYKCALQKRFHLQRNVREAYFEKLRTSGPGANNTDDKLLTFDVSARGRPVGSPPHPSYGFGRPRPVKWRSTRTEGCFERERGITCQA